MRIGHFVLNIHLRMILSGHRQMTINVGIRLSSYLFDLQKNTLIIDQNYIHLGKFVFLYYGSTTKINKNLAFIFYIHFI